MTLAETLRIEIPIETIDKTEPELSNLVKKMGAIGGAADKAGKKVTQFDRNAEKTQKGLARWAKEKYRIFLEAKEKISPLLTMLGRGLKNITRKAWSVTLRVKDFVTAPIRGVFNLLRNPIFQAGAVLGVSIGLKDTIDTYKSFEAAMSKVQAVSGAVGKDMEKLTKKAEEMGNKTKFSATESAEALNYMAMAGWKTKDMLDGIEGIMYLAGASGEDLATTSDIVTDAITAFGMTAGDASHFADVLAVASSNANTNVSMMGETFKYVGAASGALGYSVDDAALAIGIMANSGIKASQAGTELNSIFTRLATDTNGAKRAVEKLGIQFFDTKGSAREFSEVLVEMREATKDMTNEEKINFANKVAGQRAQAGLLAMLNATSDDFYKLKDAIEDADGAAMDMYEIMQDNLQGSLDSLNSKMESVKLSFGKRLSPYIRDFAEWLGNQMPAIGQALDEFMDFADQKMDGLKKKFDEMTKTREWQDADFFGKAQIAWDEFIAEPFFEWWNGTGKAKIAGIAESIGGGIGSGLKTGILMLLGIDLSDTVDEAAGVGASFAKGFSEGFDFDLIKSKLWEGFKNLFADAGKLLPGGESAGLSSVLSAAILAKIASPLIRLGKGAFSLGRSVFAPSSAGGMSLAGSLIGSTGNAMVSGTGLLGLLANIGYGVSGGAGTAGMYFGDMAGAMSGKAAALTGAGVLAGGVAAGVTVISGVSDMYHAIKSEDERGANAYGASSAMKLGGVGIGATIGTMILPGLGTAIGAGIGGIAGYIAGNKVKASYEEELEAAEKAAANAQKVFDVTGLSIDEVRFKNKALQEAMHDSEVSASEFAQMFQEECANTMKEAFGDVTLSLKEVKALAEKITFGDMKDGLEEFSAAALNVESSLSTLKSSVADLKKQKWKIKPDVEISESEIDNYKQSVGGFVESAKNYIENTHYEAIIALDLLTEGTSYHSGIDSYYGGMKSKIEELGLQLNEAMDKAMEDGVTSTEKIRLPDGTLQMSEAGEIESLQRQITEITNKVAKAQSDAEFQALGVKYSGAALDAESFASLQEELKASVASMTETYDEMLTVTLSDLNLRLSDGALKQDLVEKAVSGYQAQIGELSARVESFNLDSIAEAWKNDLDGILPGMEGDLSERLSEALNNAVAIDSDVAGWTQEYVKKMFDLDGIEESAFENIFAELKQTALAIPQKTREEMIQNLQTSIMEEYGPVSAESYGQLMEQYTSGLGEAFSAADFGPAGQSFQRSLADAVMNADRAEINGAIDVLKSDADGYVNAAFSAGMSATMPVNITAQYNLLNPSAQITMSGGGSGTATMTASVSSYSAAGQNPANHAAGGFVSGGPHLSWLAEEGYGEFVIPTNPSRRARALDLYEQAGAALGVSANAAGGYVGGSILSDTAADYYLFGNAPVAYDEIAKGKYDGEAAWAYEPVSEERESSFGSSTVQVSVSVEPEFVIHGGDGQSEEDIMKAIRRHMREMADELGGEIAGRLEEVFSNLPLKEA